MKPQSLLFAATTALLAACGGFHKRDNAAVDNRPSDFPPRRALYAETADLGLPPIPQYHGNP
ncbi:MAG: hypothetical protein Q4D61_01405 [Cardiobacteriaceae bacterium]|nr:hypothetical protein [Cardiobacteriaceae bacterium]